MYGISETQRRNATTPFSQKPGAGIARAIEVTHQLTDEERDTVSKTGILPARIIDKALTDGFDDFALAVAVRENLASMDAAPKQAA